MTWEALQREVLEEFVEASSHWAPVPVEVFVSADRARKTAWEREKRKFVKPVATAAFKAYQIEWQRKSRAAKRVK